MNLNSKIFFIAMTAVLLGALWIYTPQTSPPPKTQSLYKVITAPLDRGALKIDVSRNKKELSPKKSTTVNETPQWCLSQWDQLISLGTKQFVQILEGDSHQDFLQCFEFLKSSSLVKSFIQNSCAVKNERYVFEGDCISSIVFYRALLIDLNTPHETNFSKMPLSLLLNKILGRMIQGEEVFIKNHEEIIAMAKAIKDLEPNNPSTYKILAAVELMTNPNGQILPLIEEGLRVDPKDVNLRDLWFYAQVQNKNFDIIEYSKAHPQDDLASYYHSDHLWKNGHMDSARAMAMKLNQQFPENKRYAKTVDLLKRSQSPQDRPFFVDIPIIMETW